MSAWSWSISAWHVSLPCLQDSVVVASAVSSWVICSLSCLEASSLDMCLALKASRAAAKSVWQVEIWASRSSCAAAALSCASASLAWRASSAAAETLTCALREATSVLMAAICSSFSMALPTSSAFSAADALMTFLSLLSASRISPSRPSIFSLRRITSSTMASLESRVMLRVCSMRLASFLRCSMEAEIMPFSASHAVLALLASSAAAWFWATVASRVLISTYFSLSSFSRESRLSLTFLLSRVRRSMSALSCLVASSLVA
mmetsp:Transcript_86498/g.209755  ORF Transcript_86498/g.209755 Transcript_86498/m.209755 type:complete len:262 (+) Transcript_86498:1296-2081(+)